MLNSKLKSRSTTPACTLGLLVAIQGEAHVRRRKEIQMPVTVSTAKELGEAIKHEKDEIILEGDIKRHTLRIRATGKVAWVIAFGAIGVAVTAVIVTAGSGGTAAPATIPATVAAYSLSAVALGGGAAGISAVTAAIGIAVAAGGVGALTTLRRKYRIEKTGNVTKLIRK